MKKSLFGYGITTKSIAKSGGWEIFDDNFNKVSYDKYGNKLLPSYFFNPENSKLEITSPGIPPTHPLVRKAKNLISELDYYQNLAPLQIWITGTNGKTTTTQMTHFLLENSDIGGNIGIPLGKLNPKKIWVLEVSSFQLYYTKYAKPNIYGILPIKEDHISWHRCFEEYVKAKLSPLKRMTQRDIVIMPKKFDTPTKAYKILYENEEDLIKKFNITPEFEVPFLLDELIAKSIYYILNFTHKSLKNFKIDSHKLEEIKDKKNRLWVDDSKATNVDASLNALKRYKNKKIHLIIGGVDKGQDFTPLFEYMKNIDIELYIIGNKTAFFENLAKKHKIKYFVAKTINVAIKKIDKELKENEVALLSPACASFDQFSGYKERGDEFKKLILSSF
ncbi:UDP-N-acetylmuramoyl-L-alanine--D-glutamate ligase [Caminibacter profundus]